MDLSKIETTSRLRGKGMDIAEQSNRLRGKGLALGSISTRFAGVTEPTLIDPDMPLLPADYRMSEEIKAKIVLRRKTDTRTSDPKGIVLDGMLVQRADIGERRYISHVYDAKPDNPGTKLLAPVHVEGLEGIENMRVDTLSQRIENGDLVVIPQSAAE